MLRFVSALVLLGTAQLGLGESVPDPQYADLLYRAAAASPYLDSASVAAAASAGRYAEEIAALDDQYAVESQLAAEAELYAGLEGGYGSKVVPVVPSDAPVIATQYHAQDEFGQYSYGYSNPTSTKTEVKSLDGVVQGTYSYVSPDGRIITNNYVADPLGFRSSLAPSNGEGEVLFAAANAAALPAGAIGPVAETVAQAVGGVYGARPVLQAHPAVPEGHYSQAAYAPDYYQPDQYVDPARAHYIHPSPVEQVLGNAGNLYAPAYAQPNNYQYVEPAPEPVLTEEEFLKHAYVEPSYLEQPAPVQVVHEAAPVHSVEHHVPVAVERHQVHHVAEPVIHHVAEPVVHRVHRPAQLVPPVPVRKSVSVVHKAAPVVHEVVHKPAPVVHQVVHKHAPVVHEVAPVVHKAATHVVHHTAPVVHNVAPVVHKQAHVVHKPAHVVHKSAHVVHQPAVHHSVVHKPAPVVHQLSAPKSYHHTTTTVRKLPSVRNYGYKSYHGKPSSSSSYYRPSAYKGYSKTYTSGGNYGYGRSRSFYGRGGYGRGGYGRGYSGYSRGW